MTKKEIKARIQSVRKGLKVYQDKHDKSLWHVDIMKDDFLEITDAFWVQGDTIRFVGRTECEV